MGKFTQELNLVPRRLGNTVATPVRIVGEAGNAVANILRQGKSSAKNTAEVGKQTLDALVDNFLNFSKVEGKWYQKMLKVPLNLVSAVTRRPAMIAGATIASGLNQGVREPFKKLLYTPGKMFKGMWNATRIFSKKKGFDFASYDTHETTGDTRVNKIREKGFGFLGAKAGSSSVKEEETAIKEEKAEEKKVEEKKEEKAEEKKENKAEEKKEKKVEKIEEKKVEEKVEEKEHITDKKSDKIQEKKSKEDKNTKKDIEQKTENNPKNIHDLKENNRKESEKKDKEEQESKEWKHLDWREKAKSEKKFKEMLNDNISEEGVIDRGKKNKKGENIDQILVVLKKEYPAFAGYIEDEIISKEQGVKKAVA